ncbi:MAG: hypothetical protein KDK29_15105 [Sedimentitalea sp.]|nr:hypothetical protein [Sedimentitalea sp.]
MASTAFNTLEKDWDPVSRFTAATDVDVLLSNTSSAFAFFSITADDTAPGIDPRSAHPLQPMTGRAMQLRAGERLWLAGMNANAVLEV